MVTPARVPVVLDLTDSPPFRPSSATAAGEPTPSAPLQPDPQAIAVIPENPSISTTRLSRPLHRLLLEKQSLLRNHQLDVPRNMKHSGSAGAVQATLVFGQEEAGTAVCVSPRGLLLTCAHCVAESREDLDVQRTHWLVFASGRIVGAKYVAWGGERDLALLRIVAAQAAGGRDMDSARPDGTVPDGPSPGLVFPFVDLAEVAPQVGTRLVCVGHPGSEDLEASAPHVRTGYAVLVVSTGAYRGWGHSGAPLLERRNGKLVGLHSSWDEETGMRRGVPLEAVRAFLEANGVSGVVGVGSRGPR